MFSEQIKKLRNEKGLSQKKLAEELFVSQTTIWKWETGSATPDPEMIVKISDLFGVTADYLLGKETSPTTDMSNVSFAFAGEVKDLTEEQMESVMAFVKLLKEQNKKKG